jgi:hypothetical protein
MHFRLVHVYSTTAHPNASLLNPNSSGLHSAQESREGLVYGADDVLQSMEVSRGLVSKRPSKSTQECQQRFIRPRLTIAVAASRKLQTLWAVLIWKQDSRRLVVNCGGRRAAATETAYGMLFEELACAHELQFSLTSRAASFLSGGLHPCTRLPYPHPAKPRVHSASPRPLEGRFARRCDSGTRCGAPRASWQRSTRAASGLLLGPLGVPARSWLTDWPSAGLPYGRLAVRPDEKRGPVFAKSPRNEHAFGVRGSCAMRSSSARRGSAFNRCACGAPRGARRSSQKEARTP